MLSRTLAALDEPDLQDLDACAEALLKPLVHDSERDDDVCLLLCRTPQPEPPDAAGAESPERLTVIRTDRAVTGLDRDSVEVTRGEGGRRECL